MKKIQEHYKKSNGNKNKKNWNYKSMHTSLQKTIGLVSNSGYPSCTDKILIAHMQSSTHDFGKYIKVLPSYLLHNVVQYFLRCAVAIESQVKQKNLQCFW